MSRSELIAHARELSINRPELMTRVELRDEIIRLSETDEEQRRRARGWLGVARDLVASVVEQRLNLPDAAEMIRNANLRVPKHVPPVATVTLAEIYAAQGHLPRAIKLLDEVLLREPDHAAAEALRATLIEQQAASAAEADVDTLQSLTSQPEDWANTSPPPSVTASMPVEVADSVITPERTGTPAEPDIDSAQAQLTEFEVVSSNENATEVATEVAEVLSSAPAAAEPEVEAPAGADEVLSSAPAAAEPEVEAAAGAGEVLSSAPAVVYEAIETAAVVAEVLSSAVVDREAEPAVWVADVPSHAVAAAEPAVEVSSLIAPENVEGPGVTEEMQFAVVGLSAFAVASAAATSAKEPEPSTAVPELLGEVLLYRRSESTVVCHWSLTLDTWESRQVHRDGQWVVRVFQVKAAAGPLESEETDIELPGTSGEILLNDIEGSQQVRMAIGWKAANAFTPVIIGIEVAGDAPEQLSIAWSPLPTVADPPPDVWLDYARRSWHALSIGAAP